MRGLVIATGSLMLAGIILPADAQQRTGPAQSPQPAKPLAVKAPELAPIPSRMLKGAVSVRNTGTAASGASVTTVVCKKIVGAGSCADSPALKKYEDAAYPNALVVKTPTIQPGHVYTHSLPFWNSLKWDPGTYEFTVTADAGKQVNETNEANNVGTAQMKK